MAASTARGDRLALGARSGGSWWTNASVSRTEPSGRLVRKPTSPPSASTISVEPPPMSTTASGPPRGPGTRPTTAPEGQRRLALAVDDLDLGAQDLGGRAQERGGVGRAPQRLGADRRRCARRAGARPPRSPAARPACARSPRRRARRSAPMPRPSRVISARSSSSVDGRARWRSTPPAAASCWCRCRWSRGSSPPTIATRGIRALRRSARCPTSSAYSCGFASNSSRQDSEQK